MRRMGAAEGPVGAVLDLKRRPLPCQFGAATWPGVTSLPWMAVTISPGESLCGIVTVTSAVTGPPAC